MMSDFFCKNGIGRWSPNQQTQAGKGRQSLDGRGFQKTWRPHNLGGRSKTSTLSPQKEVAGKRSLLFQWAMSRGPAKGSHLENSESRKPVKVLPLIKNIGKAENNEFSLGVKGLEKWDWWSSKQPRMRNGEKKRCAWHMEIDIHLINKNEGTSQND